MAMLRRGAGLAVVVIALVVPFARPDEVGAGAGAPRLAIEPDHPWRPPFGLDRVGRPLAAIVTFDGPTRPEGRWSVAALRGGRQVARQDLPEPGGPGPVRVVLDAPGADELILQHEDSQGGPRRVAQLAVARDEFEAAATARPDSEAHHPIDLGTILVPADWLLLGPGQGAVLEVAAIDRKGDDPDARLVARFESAPETHAETPIPLRAGQPVRARLRLPQPPRGERDRLRVALVDRGGAERWSTSITTMIVRDPPPLPSFGAVRLKLRYDAPISVKDPQTGAFSTLDYDRAWRPDLDDVVVCLPNGGRFVFWRGASYIPFWAGRHNTGLCYEWAENIRRPPDAVDCVEPLMDKELKYGRVEIVESTPARVHVRWRYQSTDLHYKVWGDSAVEDYFFYPDGFGTRVLTLDADPASGYELCELIVLAPQEAYPFAFLPERPIELLMADGSARSIAFPVDRAAEAELRRSTAFPAVYRVRFHRDEPLAAVLFHPDDRALPPLLFGPFSDAGQVVTPAYWGSHWPLARGQSTRGAIDDRIHASPSHNSLMTWAEQKPPPLLERTRRTLDALGRPREMLQRRWAWLIGMTDEPDDRLRARAASFAAVPALTLAGASWDADAFAPERRAVRLVADGPEVTIAARPDVPWVNPVLEVSGAPGALRRVEHDGRPLPAERFAWDGRTLWLDLTIRSPAPLRLIFEGPK